MIQAITLLLIALLTAADQLIKRAVVEHLASGGTTEFFFGLFRLRYVENTGAAFSSFENQTTFLTLFTIAVIAICLFVLMTKKIKPGPVYFSLAVVLAGGIGNLIDRLLYGYVIDYIEPLFVNFAVFNFADCCVTVGAGVMIIFFIIDIVRESRADRERQTEETPENDTGE